MLTGSGRLSRVFLGLDPTPGALKNAIDDAAQDRLGTLGERIRLFCAGLGESLGRYSSLIITLLRAASLAAVALLALGILLLSRRSAS